MINKMFDNVRILKNTLEKIPFMLRIITIIFLGFGLFIIAVIPNKNMIYNINGISMNYSEYLKTGAPFIFLAISIICPLCGYTIINRIKWGRFIMLFGYMFPSLILVIFPVENISVMLVLQYIIFTAIIYWYLFRKKTVVDYYNNKGIN